MNPLYEIEQYFPDFRKDLADKVPVSLQGGLARYLLDGVVPGKFLLAVLVGDLFAAVRHADDDSMAGLKPIVMFLFNSVPANAFGNVEASYHWVGEEGLRGRSKRAPK